MHEFLAILCCTNVFLIRTCADIMDFVYGVINYSILAANVNPVTVPHSGAITAGDNRTASCSLAVAKDYQHKILIKILK